MMRLFDQHFRPALHRLSPETLRYLIFGWDAPPAENNRDSVREELINFVEDLTNSAEALGILDQPQPRQEEPGNNVEE